MGAGEIFFGPHEENRLVRKLS